MSTPTKNQHSQDDRTTWRNFEKLVFKIQTHLSQRNRVNADVILDNKAVWDYSAEAFRQVDCTIKYSIDSREVFIAVECRKRKNKQDVQWLDSLIGKKIDIRADLMIGVSSQGFTKTALKKAHSHGILLRTLEENITDNILEEYNIVLTQYRYQLKNTSSLFWGGDEETKSFITSKLAKLSVQEPLIIFIRERLKLSINYLCNRLIKSLPEVSKNITFDGFSTKMNFKEKEALIQHPKGYIEVRELTLNFSAITKVSDIFDPTKHLYLSEDGNKINGIFSSKYESLDGDIKELVAFISPKDGTLHNFEFSDSKSVKR